MRPRAFGQISLRQPDLDGPEFNLSNVTTLEDPQGTLKDFRYAEADIRELDLMDAHLIRGVVTRLQATRVRLQQVRLTSVEFSNSNFGNLHWDGGKLSRVVFRDCKIMGAAFSGLVLDDVLFENCKLDYTTFTDVRAVGPAVFSQCALTEASFADCDLRSSVFDVCALNLTEFGRGRYRDVDLRGNDLSAIRGVSSLHGVIIHRAQQVDLAQALVADLDITFGEDLTDPLNRA